MPRKIRPPATDIIFGDDAEVVTHAIAPEDALEDYPMDEYPNIDHSQRYLSSILDNLEELFTLLTKEDEPGEHFPVYTYEGKRLPPPLCVILEELEIAREELY